MLYTKKRLKTVNKNNYVVIGGKWCFSPSEQRVPPLFWKYIKIKGEGVAFIFVRGPKPVVLNIQDH